MEPIDYLRAVRRRWWIPALAVLVATIAVVVTMPHPARGHRAGVSYKATATLLYTAPPGSNTNGNTSPVQSLGPLPLEPAVVLA